MADNPGLSVPATEKLGHEDTGPTAAKQAISDGKPGQNEAIYVSKNERGWRRVVRNFSPSWFSVTMGTGICATILYTIPWKASWIYYLEIIFFCLNVAIFAVFFVISFLRYTIW